MIADSSYGGTYRGSFRDAIDRAEIDQLQTSLARDAARGVREVGPADDAAGFDARPLAERLGNALFRTVFSGELETGLRDTMVLAQRDGRQLRIRLRLESVPSVAPLPWELLRDEARGRFVALTDQTQIVRHLGRPEPVRNVALSGPLRVLVVVASPTDLPPVSTEREWEALDAELQPLITTGRLELRRLTSATFAELRAALLEGPWHVFHFVGHGHHAPAALAFCDAGGRADLIEARTLAASFADSVELRLAVLNACHSARASERDAFGGVAQELLERSVPAVVAMQFAVSDSIAVEFAGRFYAAVTRGWPVDRAVGEARRLLADHSNEWATPVVHLRGDGIVFEPTTQRGAWWRRRRVLAGAVAVLALIAGIAAALTRGGDDGDDDAEPPPCPTVDATWKQVPLSADPSGTHPWEHGPIDVAARSLAWEPDADGWLVVAELAVTNRTDDTFSIGEYRFPNVVVANRAFEAVCFDATQDSVDAGRTADVRVGYDVGCEPVGLIEIVTEDSGLELTVSEDSTPSAC